MKKYISPEIVVVRLAMTRPIAGSITPDGATFYDTDAETDGMSKSITDINIWDDEW